MLSFEQDPTYKSITTTPPPSTTVSVATMEFTTSYSTTLTTLNTTRGRKKKLRIEKLNLPREVRFQLPPGCSDKTKLVAQFMNYQTYCLFCGIQKLDNSAIIGPHRSFECPVALPKDYWDRALTIVTRIVNNLSIRRLSKKEKYNL